MFHDRARIRVKGGRGGDGSLSFRREKFVPKGGPDGGDGGHGGDVVLVADPDLRDLSYFHRSTRFEAKRGRHGEGSNKRGADGDDVELGVPVGTQVLDEEGRLLADLAHRGARVIAAHGGHGGAGNRRFATPTHQAPRLAELGSVGEEAALELRLKLLADAALLGFPNAGKSSLLRRVSNAKPKVADYPFTTIAPVLGTVEAPDGRQLTVADVPGLLEGASEGVGLGDEFLAHLERARMFVHVIDAQEDVEARFHAIDRELAAYGAGLADRPQIVVLNKLDLLQEPPRLRHRGSAHPGDPRGLGGHRPGDRPAQARALRPDPGGGPGPDRGGRAGGLPRLPSAAAASAPVPDLSHPARLSRPRPGDRGRSPARRRQGRRGRRVRGRVTVGLLGGAFDPPHCGHVVLAREAMQRFGLHRLLVLVVTVPAHKPVETPLDARLELARAAFSGIARRGAAGRPRLHGRLAPRRLVRPGRNGLPRRRRRVRELPLLEGA